MIKIAPPDNEDNFDELNGLITIVLILLGIILGILFI